jgi:hypothetical protein
LRPSVHSWSASVHVGWKIQRGPSWL